MPRPERRAIIEKLQAARDGRFLLGYVTSTRPGFEVPMADDVLRLAFDHLEAGKKAAGKGVDLFIHSNGGMGTVPWRLVSLIREYTKEFAVLVPHHAFSAATLVALGADKILMHRMGCLGPIDPSVTNLFNPPHPNAPGQPAPISVEDVTAYFKLVKDEIGITHEDELVQALAALTDKIHPLALGNVQRSHNQSRMMAAKLLKQHMPSEKEHEIQKIIDNLKSNLFFHGHPINRTEATKDLNLKVETPPADVEGLMWELYREYERSLKLTEQFSPVHELDLKSPSAAAPPPAITTQQIVAQMIQLAQNGIGLGQGVSEEQLVRLARAMVPAVSGTQQVPQAGAVRLDPLKGAYMESLARADVFLTDMTVERVKISTPMGPQDATRQEVLWQRWEEET